MWNENNNDENCENKNKNDRVEKCCQEMLTIAKCLFDALEKRIASIKANHNNVAAISS